MTAVTLLCVVIMGCERSSQPKASELPAPAVSPNSDENVSDNEKGEWNVGTFELIEIKSLEEFRKIYLTEPPLHLGHDDDWEYVGSKCSDSVHKVSRKIVDQQALRNIQAQRSKIVYAPPGGPPLHRRSKEFLDWLEKTKRLKD